MCSPNPNNRINRELCNTITLLLLYNNAPVVMQHTSFRLQAYAEFVPLPLGRQKMQLTGIQGQLD